MAITLEELDSFVATVQREFKASPAAKDQETEVGRVGMPHTRFALVLLHHPDTAGQAAPIFCLVERTTGEIYNCSPQGHDPLPSGVHITWPDIDVFITTKGVITASQALRSLELQCPN